MRTSVLASLLAILASQVLAAPKGGGGKGGGGGGGSRGGGSSSCTVSNPCNSGLEFMYGYRYTSLFTNTELYGQTAVYGVWILVLIGCYIRLRKIPAVTIRLATLSFIICFAFLVVRYGLILGGVSVPLGYRHEASIVVLFWRLGMPFLFAAVCMELDLGKLTKLAAIIGIGIYAILNISYIILDFLVSAQAVTHFRAQKEWWLSDRDFGLTYDPSNIEKLRLTASGGNDGLSPSYIRSRVFDPTSIKFLQDRALVIKLGLAADYLAVAISCFLMAITVLRFMRRKTVLIPNTALLLVAASSLLVTSFFRIIIGTHYILHNWGVVTNDKEWADWIKSYGSLDITTGIIPPAGFLNGYRVTVTGFPIVQAILEQIGVVVACVLVIHVAVKMRKGLAVNNAMPKV